MLDQLVEFLKSAIVEQEIDPFPRRHLAGGVLLLDARSAAACFGAAFPFAQLIELADSLCWLLLRGHDLSKALIQEICSERPLAPAGTAKRKIAFSPPSF